MNLNIHIYSHIWYIWHVCLYRDIIYNVLGNISIQSDIITALWVMYNNNSDFIGKKIEVK
jgi:hypothetical protein